MVVKLMRGSHEIYPWTHIMLEQADRMPEGLSLVYLERAYPLSVFYTVISEFESAASSREGSAAFLLDSVKVAIYVSDRPAVLEITYVPTLEVTIPAKIRTG